MPVTCAQLYKWKIKRLENQSRYGTEQERRLAELGLLTAQRFKYDFLKNCKKDPALPFYKDEEDYNTKQDKVEKILKKAIDNLETWTDKKQETYEKKIKKILLQ